LLIHETTRSIRFVGRDLAGIVSIILLQLALGFGAPRFALPQRRITL